MKKQNNNILKQPKAAVWRKNQRAGNTFKLPALTILDVLFFPNLLREGRNFLCTQRLTVNVDIVDKAGEVGSVLHHTGTDTKAVTGAL
jgi:hypothetical protein